MSNLVGEMLVGRVGFGESFQACPANYSAEDAMARSIVRLECEADELRAEVALLQEQARILVSERDEARDAIDRLATIASEAFGPLPVQSAEDNLTAIEQGIYQLRMDNEKLELERYEARAMLEGIWHEQDPLLVQMRNERDEAREALREIEAAVWKTSGELRGMARRALEAAK